MNKFELYETPYNTWTVNVSDEFYHSLPLRNLKAPLPILFCRLFQLNYVDYMRFVRDEFGAKLHGKQGYIFYDFESKESAIKFKEMCEKKFAQWEAIA